jgi:sugar lactone lactonase YvrE
LLTAVSSDGTVVAGGSKGKRTSQLSTPAGVVITEEGQLYIADSDNARVLKWEDYSLRAGENTSPTTVFTAPRLKRPRGIAVTPEGALYVADAHSHVVYRWIHTNPLLWMFPRVIVVAGSENFYGDRPSELQLPGAIAVHKEGLYVSEQGNHRVTRWRVDAKELADQAESTASVDSWNHPHHYIVAGGNGEGSTIDQLSKPGGLALMLQDDVASYLFVVDKGNHRVMRVTLETGAKKVVAGTGMAGKDADEFCFPEGVVLDASGAEKYMYIVDSGNDRITRWRVNGNSIGSPLVVIGAGVDGDGESRLKWPYGISLNSMGVLAISDTENSRILAWKMSGQSDSQRDDPGDDDDAGSSETSSPGSRPGELIPLVLPEPDRSWGVQPWLALGAVVLCVLCRRSADSDDRTTHSVELQPASEDKEFLRALVDLSNDAAGMVDEGRYDDAEDAYRRVLQGYESKLGPNHPSTLTASDNLARFFDSQGLLDEAEELYLRLLAGYEARYGVGHPFTESVSTNLATVRYKAGRGPAPAQKSDSASRSTAKSTSAEGETKL